MDKFARIVEFAEIIQKAGTISVRALEERYSYSFSTMQRDLNHLSSIGVVERKYGKICAKSIEPISPNKKDALPTLQFCKEAIRHMAQCLLKPNETIYITHGSTALEVARAFSDQVCHKVFTDGLDALEALGSKPIISNVLPGRKHQLPEPAHRAQLLRKHELSKRQHQSHRDGGWRAYP